MRFLPPLSSRTDLLLAMLLWATALAAVTAILIDRPDRRGVTAVYAQAAEDFQHRRPLYTEGYKGFLYAPPAAMAYVPFRYPTPLVGGLLWRLLGVALLAMALRGLSRLLCPGHLFLLSLLVLPAAWSSLRNGQSNLHLSALLLLAALDLGRGRFRRASLFMVLGFVAKPVALPLLFLAPLLFAGVLPSLLGALALAGALPFLLAPSDYVSGQYAAFLAKALRSSQPEGHVYSDLLGLLTRAGIPLASELRLPLLLAGAAATAALAWLRLRPQTGPSRALGLWMLVAAFLMLFNPRNEANSYVILAPAVAACAVEIGRRRGIGAASFLLLLGLGLGADNFGRWIHQATDRWFKPALALLFVLWLVGRLRRPILRDDWGPPPSPTLQP